MEDQEYYYDVSYRRTKQGPEGFVRRLDMESVTEWLKKNEGQLHIVMILRMPGNPEGLQDREV